MPMYRYRREDGTEFEIRQKFSDDPLTVDPETGQAVVRVILPTGIVFKGSGFYVNDSRSSSNSNGRSPNGSKTDTDSSSSEATSATAAKETKTETKASSSSSGSDAAD